ncbi:MAG: hypothetical protein ACTHM2_09005 [Afipia sp.]|jgi:hypothetical protein
MAVAEISAAVTGIRAALDISKAMVSLRDEEAFRAKSIELQGVVLDAFEKAIEAREAHTLQGERISSLEAEVANLKAWDTEKQRYELKPIGQGSVAYVLKPEARGTETPHWLCPNCFSQNKKSFFQATGSSVGRDPLYECVGCKSKVLATSNPTVWPT